MRIEQEYVPQIRPFPGTIRVSVDVPDFPHPDDVLVALGNLSALRRGMLEAEGGCWECGTRRSAWHRPDCPLAPEGLIDAAREQAIKEGMRP